VLVLFVFFSAPVWADPGAADVRVGNDLYRKGKFQEALERYEKAVQKNPSEAKIEYNLGAAAYQSRDYDLAIEHFQKGLLTDDDKFRRDVHFNLGDAFYRSGRSREDKDIEQGIKRFELSLESFEKARSLDLKDKEAIENYEFVKKELERLKQKKQQQKQQQQKQQQSQQENKDQKKDENPSQPDDQKSDEQKSQDQKDSNSDKQDKENKAEDDRSKNDASDKGQADQSQQAKNQAQPGNPPNDQNNSASGQTLEGQISSQKDANDMMDNFERNELPKGLLNFIRRSGEARPVDKDW
jgi:Ca-activated chloride channel family protein